MSKNKKNKQPERPALGASDVVLSIIPAVFTLGVRTVAGPCVHDDGTVGACSSAGRVLMVLGIVAVAVCIMRLMSADHRTKRSFDLMVFALGLAIAILPGTGLQLCMMETMHCRAVMQPFARIMGAVMSVAALVCEFTIDQEVPTGRKKRR